MNTFHDRIGLRVLRIVVASLLLVAAPIPSSALDGSRTLLQYVHDSWGVENGFPGGTIYAIARSSDGYLWLGTEHGLVRFDGDEFKAIPAPLPGHRPVGAVRGLIEDADGNLWIRLDGPRLLRYRDGIFKDAVAKFGLSDATFTAMSQTSQGELLLWGPRNRTLRFHGGHFTRINPRDDINGIVISVMDAGDGALWLGSRDAGLYRIQRGQCTEVLSETRLQSVNALVPSRDGGVWIGSETGLRLWEHGTVVDLHLPLSLSKAPVFALARDHQNNLWVGTDHGLYRIDSQRRVVTGFLRSAGAPVSAIYEDEEGDLWFANGHGLERMRDGMFTSFTLQGSLHGENSGPIFADSTGRIWFAPASGGLFDLENGTLQRVAVPGLNNDVVYSISGGDGELWLGRQRGGLTELTRQKNGWLARTFTRKDGLPQNSVYTVDRTRDGAVWAGTVSGGVSVLRHGRVKTYTVDNGLQSNAIFSSMEASNGTMWFASPSGLVSFDGRRWTTYGADGTQPPPNVRTVFEDSGHVLWVGTSHGLARFDHGQIEMLRGLPQALTEEVLGIGQDDLGFLWVVTAQHVLQVNRARLLSGTLTEDDMLSYGADDGLLETEGMRRDRSLVTDPLGRIWLSLPHSIAVADVKAAADYRWHAGVRIDSVSPRGTSSMAGPLNLPPETRSVTFRYSSTDMSMSRRIQFRYRLDGSDHAWSNDTSLRQVIYTHLSPGQYTFRIMASNGLGYWNGRETDLPFTIRPALWQTWYFRILCLLALGIAAVVLYRIRLLQRTEQLDRLFQERLEERTRIAQDLHDTLLQGVLSASMQLDVAQEHLEESSPVRPMLRRVLQLMHQVTEDGRETLRGLRTINNSMSLEAAFAHLAEEVGLEQPPGYRFHIQGDPRRLQPAVRDEVYRIGREALLNSFMHAQASRTELTIEYGLHAFRLSVHDDGCGIDPCILKNGSDGHWGLPGMRERAQAIGSTLSVSSHIQRGTAVELVVPGVIAYSDQSPRRPWWSWSKRTRDSEVCEDRESPQ